MLSEDIVNYYYPKLAIRILAYMRKRRYEEELVNTDDLIEKFEKSKSIVSQNIKILLGDNLIYKKYVGNPHISGARYEYELTSGGLIAVNNFLFEWLTENEKKTIRKMNTPFEIGEYISEMW